MKKIFQVFACCGMLFFLAFLTQSSLAPEPIPAPEETVYSVQDLDGYKVAVYMIAHDGYCCFNEGPYFPDDNNEVYYSQWKITYYTSTYARVWEWDDIEEEWDLLGDIRMDTSNTIVGPPGKVQTFYIDKDDIPST